MILKGSQRGFGADLATHLMNEFDNEWVELAQVHGTVAEDLHGAFAEYEAVAAGTRATEPLYSLSINPSAPLTRDQYFAAIDKIEARLGLTDQPRAVVFHVKDGREHGHVVWSRIDTEKMRAIQMSHDRRRLCDMACELAHEYGLDLPPGLKAWEKKQRFEKDRLEPSFAEKAQAEETGLTADQRRDEITAAFEAADSAAAFRQALAENGYILARGDRRGYVVVDRFEGVHSLTRYIKGHKAKDVKAKLAGLDAAALPDVERAKALADERRQAAKEQIAAEQAAQEKARQEQAREKARASLQDKQRARRLEVTQAEQDLLTRQAEERMALDKAQAQEREGLGFRLRSAVADLIGRTPGLRSVLHHIQKQTGLDPRERHRLERDALKRRHAREKTVIDRRKRALAKVEAREAQSLEKALRRQRRQAHMQAMEGRPEERRHSWKTRRALLEEGGLGQSFNKEAVDTPAGDDHGGDDDGDRRHGWKARAEKKGLGKKRDRGYRRSDD